MPTTIPPNTHPPHFATPEEAETAFYAAISSGDLDALMRIWAVDDEVVCTHPTGQQLIGLSAIRESWRQILATPELKIVGNRVNKWQSMVLSVHHTIESLQVGQELTGPLQATNVYAQGPHGWRLVCRHSSASLDPVTTLSSDRILH